MRGAICHGRPGFVHARFREMRASGRRVLRFLLSQRCAARLAVGAGCPKIFSSLPEGSGAPRNAGACEGSPAGVIQLAGLAVVAIGFSLVMKR
jgi:hypothetical protein